MSKVTDIIDDYLQNNLPGKKVIRQKYADEALKEFERLVFERDQAWTDLEDLTESFSFCMKIATEYENRCNGFAVEDVFLQQIILADSPEAAQEVLSAYMLQENCLGGRTLTDNRVQMFWPCATPPASWVNIEILQKQLPEGFRYVCLPKFLQGVMLKTPLAPITVLT